MVGWCKGESTDINSLEGHTNDNAREESRGAAIMMVGDVYSE